MLAGAFQLNSKNDYQKLKSQTNLLEFFAVTRPREVQVKRNYVGPPVLQFQCPLTNTEEIYSFVLYKQKTM